MILSGARGHIARTVICSIVALCSFLKLHNYLSSSQVWCTRFGFISLGSLTAYELLCVLDYFLV